MAAGPAHASLRQGTLGEAMRCRLQFWLLLSAAEGARGCEQPRCTTAAMQGAFTDDTFAPAAGCYHGVPTPSETIELLRGSWYLTAGGSNAWATFQALANQIEPYIEAYSPDKGFLNKRWVDIVWQAHANGSYTLQHYHWLNTTGLAALGAPVHQAFALPAWSADRVRLTFAHCLLWPNCTTAVAGMNEAPGGWAAARRLLYVQSGAWYDRYNYLVDEYAAQLATFLAQHAPTCEQAHVDCFVASVSCLELDAWPYANQRCNANDQQMNAQLSAQLGAYSAAFTHLDLVALLSAKPEEFPGHPSPALALWTQWGGPRSASVDPRTLASPCTWPSFARH